MKKRKIDDFGEKIGGAKKEFWATLRELSLGEKAELAVRDRIWKRPDYQALSDKNHIPREVLYWRNEVRKSVFTRPQPGYDPEGYIRFCMSLKEHVESCDSMDNIRAFYNQHLFAYLVRDENDMSGRNWKYADTAYTGYFNGNVLLRYVRASKRIVADCEKAGFLLTENERYSVVEVTSENLSTKPSGKMFENIVRTSKAFMVFIDMQDWTDMLSIPKDHTLRVVLRDNQKVALCFAAEEVPEAIEEDKEKRVRKKAIRKEAFLPPHLSHITRTGSSYQYFRFTDPYILVSRYGLRGGEFGNYEAAKDRLGSLNMAYDAFEDLAAACGVTPKDLSLGEKLAIAFGARGRGNALAHYEPLKNVINLTKLRGAGSLAHEWGHAFDRYLGNIYGCADYVSNNPDADGVPKEIRQLVKSMKQMDGKMTNFYTNSKKFDKSYSKTGNGYWSSAPEMFARAFACFVRDQIDAENRRSDYLVGHSEFAVNEAGVAAIPLGDERKELDKKFKELFDKLIELGIFSTAKTEPVKEEANIIDVVLYTGEDGQLKFC